MAAITSSMSVQAQEMSEHHSIKENLGVSAVMDTHLSKTESTAKTKSVRQRHSVSMPIIGFQTNGH